MYKYVIIRSTYTQDFVKRVTEALNKGWQLYGNPFVDSQGDYQQALCIKYSVKEEEPEDLEPVPEL